MSDAAAKELASAIRDAGESIFQGAGVLARGLVAAVIANKFAWQASKDNAAQVGRHAAVVMSGAWKPEDE